MFRHQSTDRGFSLTELMLVVAVVATIAGAAIPVLGDVNDSIKLGEAARLVERELQDARLKAVSSNRPLRVRTNCPGVGYIRRVEVIGTAEDNATNRCQPSAYPFPADNDIMTRPNHDGPVMLIPNGATVGNATIQFNPDGTAYQVVSNVVTTISGDLSLSVVRKSSYRTVTVNALGKVNLQ